MSLPDMIPVTSSNIDCIGYDEQNQELYIRFLNGSLYVYKGVPENEYQNIIEAPSHGSYLASNIKNTYPYERIE